MSLYQRGCVCTFKCKKKLDELRIFITQFFFYFFQVDVIENTLLQALLFVLSLEVNENLNLKRRCVTGVRKGNPLSERRRGTIFSPHSLIFHYMQKGKWEKREREKTQEILFLSPSPPRICERSEWTYFRVDWREYK